MASRWDCEIWTWNQGAQNQILKICEAKFYEKDAKNLFAINFSQKCCDFYYHKNSEKNDVRYEYPII